MSSLAPTSTGALSLAPVQLAAMPPGPTGKRFDPRQLWVVLLHRALLGLGVAAVASALVLILALQAAPVYQAVATVLVEPNQGKVIKDDPAAAALPSDTGVVDTQVEVLKTRVVAERVVSRLKLYADPEFNPEMARAGAATYRPDPHTVDKVIDRVSAGLDVRRLGLTYVIEVAYRAHSASKAAQIANTFVEEYLAQQIQGKINANRLANGWLNASLDKLRSDSLAADSRVQEYINAHNLMSSDGQVLFEQNVTKLNDTIATATADTAEKQARLAAAEMQLRSGGENFGAEVNSETVRDLRKAEADESRQVAELGVTFGPKYPDLLKARTKLADIRRQISTETNRILSGLRGDLKAAQQREQSLRGSLGTARGGLVNNNQAQVQLIALKQQAEAARKVYEAYLNRADQLAAQDGVQLPDARLASRAASPVHPIAPKKSLAAAGAALLGLLSGLTAIIIAEFLSGTMRTRADVEQKLDAPFAGVIPDPARLRLGGRRRKDGAPADLIVEKPFSSYAEAFRNLRASLQYWNGGHGAPRVIAVTSALPREGKSTTALGLARAFATSGSRVLLVDCDFRRSALNAMIGDPQYGLGDVLEGEAKISEVIIQDPRTSALILPWGRMPGAKELMSASIFDDAMEALKEKFDHVVIDTPPVLAVADARLIAAKADVALMVTEWDKTPSRAAAAAVELLRSAGVNLMGVALTKVDVRLHAHYGYGDSPYAYKAVQAYYGS
jgi:capsular exopolysaccharide synthesis family protein